MDDAMCWSTARAQRASCRIGDLEGLDDNLIDLILATNVRGSFAAVRALRPCWKGARSRVARWSSIFRPWQPLPRWGVT